MGSIVVENVSKNFGGVKALQGVSLVIPSGMLTSIVGPNGSGKTTLMNIITGLVPFDEGKMVLFGKPYVRITPPEAFSLGIVRTFQEVRIFDQMSVLDNILVVLTDRRLFLSLKSRNPSIYLQKAERVLQIVGLWEKREEMALNLSYGQRKLLEIARVLAVNPRVILLDEPFAGVFQEVRRKILALLQDLKKEGKTIVLIEHQMDVIRRYADKVYVLDSGRVLAEGPPDEVLERQEVIQAYLGE